MNVPSLDSRWKDADGNDCKVYDITNEGSDQPIMVSYMVKTARRSLPVAEFFQSMQQIPSPETQGLSMYAPISALIDSLLLLPRHQITFDPDFHLKSYGIYYYFNSAQPKQFDLTWKMVRKMLLTSAYCWGGPDSAPLVKDSGLYFKIPIGKGVDEFYQKLKDNGVNYVGYVHPDDKHVFHTNLDTEGAPVPHWMAIALIIRRMSQAVRRYVRINPKGVVNILVDSTLRTIKLCEGNGLIKEGDLEVREDENFVIIKFSETLFGPNCTQPQYLQAGIENARFRVEGEWILSRVQALFNEAELMGK